MYRVVDVVFLICRFGKFCGIVIVEFFVVFVMGLIVGVMVFSIEVVMVVGLFFMIVFIVFGGYYVNVENTFIVFRWIFRVFLIRW